MTTLTISLYFFFKANELNVNILIHGCKLTNYPNHLVKEKNNQSDYSTADN